MPIGSGLALGPTNLDQGGSLDIRPRDLPALAHDPGSFQKVAVHRFREKGEGEAVSTATWTTVLPDAFYPGCVAVHQKGGMVIATSHRR